MKKKRLSQFEQENNRAFLTTKRQVTIPINGEVSFGNIGMGLYLVYDHTIGNASLVDVHSASIAFNQVIYTGRSKVTTTEGGSGELLYMHRKTTSGDIFIKNTSTTRDKIVSLIHVGF